MAVVQPARHRARTGRCPRCASAPTGQVRPLAASYQEGLDGLHEALPPLGERELSAVFGGTAARVYRLAVEA